VGVAREFNGYPRYDGPRCSTLTNAAPIGEVLELRCDRRLVGLTPFLPFVKAVGQGEMDVALATVHDAIRNDLDRGDVLGADAAGRSNYPRRRRRRENSIPRGAMRVGLLMSAA
jgi:hypothetical protein